ncbi:transposable element Tc1 transposase [Trichonephila clavipes]|nr:transposable element Tc1 transposase [Trichonephila clavipes]
MAARNTQHAGNSQQTEAIVTPFNNPVPIQNYPLNQITSTSIQQALQIAMYALEQLSHAYSRARLWAKRNHRVTSTRVTSMVTASIGKAISAATVRRRLHINGLYARVPRVCVPLSIQSKGARLKWYREHGNWTVSDWGNVMFTDESRFAPEPDDKRIRQCFSNSDIYILSSKQPPVAAVAEWYRYRIVTCLVTSSSPVPLKTRRVGQRCTLNLSRAETSSRWCGVVVRRGGCHLRCRPRHLTMVQNYVVRRQKPSCS